MLNEDEPELSIVIPLYNEEANVEALRAELTESLAHLGRSYEIVLVDDGSTDGTAAALAAWQESDPRARVLRLRRNFGQTAAFSAGFDHARGEIVVTSDGDLQNDPADIPRLLNKLDEGLDMVCGWRRRRRDPLSKRVPSWFANRLISWATGVHLHDYGCGSTERCTASSQRWRPGWVSVSRRSPRITGRAPAVPASMASAARRVSSSTS
jgi:glycosyltransferase involved in cell wall biosynthesis